MLIVRTYRRSSKTLTHSNVSSRLVVAPETSKRMDLWPTWQVKTDHALSFSGQVCKKKMLLSSVWCNVVLWWWLKTLAMTGPNDAYHKILFCSWVKRLIRFTIIIFPLFESESSSNWTWIFVRLKLNLRSIELNLRSIETESSLDWTWIFVRLRVGAWNLKTAQKGPLIMTGPKNQDWEKWKKVFSDWTAQNY